MGDDGRMDRIEEFLEATADREPRPLLLQALDGLTPARRALELGCGAGVDVVALLDRGLHVTAVDIYPGSVARAETMAAERERPGTLETRCSCFTDLELAPGRVDIVHAAFSLPFSPTDRFPGLWVRLRGWLRPGGRFVGQLFGDHDEWAGRDDAPANTFHSREEVDRLLADWTVLHLDEVDRPGRTAVGTEKHWHVFHLILEKPAP